MSHQLTPNCPRTPREWPRGDADHGTNSAAQNGASYAWPSRHAWLRAHRTEDKLPTQHIHTHRSHKQHRRMRTQHKINGCCHKDRKTMSIRVNVIKYCRPKAQHKIDETARKCERTWPTGWQKLNSVNVHLQVRSSSWRIKNISLASPHASHAPFPTRVVFDYNGCLGM